MSLIKPGKYLARVVDHDLRKNADGSVRDAAVTFSFMAEGAEKKLTWFGSFNGGAAKITLETLMRLGLELNSKEELALLSRGGGEGEEPGPIYLNVDQDFEIEVENNEWQGKVSNRIKWVNEPGRGSFKRMSAEEAKVTVGGLNIDADLAELQQKRQNAPKGPTQAPAKKTPF